MRGTTAGALKERLTEKKSGDGSYFTHPHIVQYSAVSPSQKEKMLE